MQLIAHRGASADCPENTLPAVERALALDATAIELDLLKTRDDRVVARHDDLIWYDGAWSQIAALDYADLERLDVGRGARVPLLEHLLTCVDGRCTLFLELKTYGLVPAVLRLVDAHAARRWVHLTSFLHEEIRLAGHLAPDIPRSIISSAVPITFEPLFQDAGTREVSLFRGYVTEALVQRLKAARVVVRVYPVNLPEEAARFAAWGVDGVFTDDLARLRQHLTGSPAPRPPAPPAGATQPPSGQESAG